jgi:predicted TPR repeat methyltransferase
MTESSTDNDFELAKAEFLDGLSCFQRGSFGQAEKHYLASLQALPGRASTLINLAATQLQLGHPQEAMSSADAALKAEPDSTEALLHRATALMQLERFGEALSGFDRLLERDASALHGWLRRSQTLERLGAFAEALASFERALALDPENAEAWSGQGSLLRELHRFDESAHAFRMALRHGADPDLHAYYLASVQGGKSPSTAPRKYVEGLFNNYADEFDKHLVDSLRYTAHVQLIDGLKHLAPGPYTGALDMGCGTGLCGPLVRPLVDRLTGVDLSAAMLLKAQELGVYDKLEKMDVVEFLEQGAQRFDLILAADVFIYIGDLTQTFAAARNAMNQGIFCFSVELLDDGAGDFQLLPSLRYAHCEAYLRRLCSRFSFNYLAGVRALVREDQGRPIHGLYVYLGAAPTIGQLGAQPR